MSYEIPTFRPPNEARSLLIRATPNCPWNRCAFCRMHKGLQFELRPTAEMKDEIWLLKSLTDEVTAWAASQGYGDRLVGALG